MLQKIGGGEENVIAHWPQVYAASSSLCPFPSYSLSSPAVKRPELRLGPLRIVPSLVAHCGWTGLAKHYIRSHEHPSAARPPNDFGAF